ncbi:putative high-affinity nicotinic acid transporter [Phaeomoniella chlamydospora]|uniref:Putative high-affinity nicotinic acid transporter n=1 Tax=Phaeomoniella chlamydospora TaxID=158046 RepID=A0A0G2E174_PHACM|nr:putative high-affinity nicotinic acid transporter [Phaeomoniella chlamydospora]
MSKAEKAQAVGAIAKNPNVSLETFAHLDIDRLLRKIDLRLIPMLTLLARQRPLHRPRTLMYDHSSFTAFFFTYCAFEVPSNIILKRLRPSIWLPTIMVAWGIVMTLMGLVKSYSGLLTARIFLGVAEAGLFPGVVYYNTMWYCRYEIQVRQAYFFSAASVAGAFSGLLAYGISFMDGVGNLAGWRWIFILEGILTVLVAITAFFVLVDYPETASFLTIEERAFITYRLKYDNQSPTTSSSSLIPQTESLSRKHLISAFRDWQIWLNVIVYWGYVCPLYGISLFLPTIIKELGYKTTTAQLLTVPIYVTAGIITIVIAYIADRKRIRSPFILGGLITQLIGFIMCISTSSPGVTYAGIFIAACGIYECQPSNITWLSNNLAGSYKRAVGMGIQISVGNLAGGLGVQADQWEAAGGGGVVDGGKEKKTEAGKMVR